MILQPIIHRNSEPWDTFASLTYPIPCNMYIRDYSGEEWIATTLIDFYTNGVEYLTISGYDNEGRPVSGEDIDIRSTAGGSLSFNGYIIV